MRSAQCGQRFASPISVGNLASGHGRAVKVRIGVATGVVLVGDIIGEGASQQQAVSGETVNLASRLQALANPNSVVIGAGTRELLGDQFDYEQLGPQKLKGISELVHAWRVTGERAVETRFRATHADRLTKFFGRDHEVELLLERWRRGKAGEGRTSGAAIGRSGYRKVSNHGDAARPVEGRGIHPRRISMLRSPREQPSLPGHPTA